MTTLRVIVEPVLSETPDGVSRYARELAVQLIATAPAGCDVEGVVAAHDSDDDARLAALLPGLANVNALSLGRRELTVAWQMGARLPALTGMIHSPSLLAPLRKHDRRNDGTQIVVTIHDVTAWTAPETLSATEVLWQKAMAKRARKHADAVVVPTHAVAEQLAEAVDLGDRIRVIGGAPTGSVSVPRDADARATRLGLPDRFVATVGSLEPRRGIRALIEAMSLPQLAGVPLLIAGGDEYGDERISDVAMSFGLPEGRVRALGNLDDADLAVLLDRAAVFVYPSLASGFGLPMIEAFQLGAPVVHSDDPALVEVAFGAGVTVARQDAAGYPSRLADAIGEVLDDASLADRLAVTGADRARAFSWRDSAEQVWQLHADL
jgi:Glycosyltransferase